MEYLWLHLEDILQAYDGRLPLHHFLKDYFKAQPRLGSRDRRGLSDAVYAWYRSGKAIADYGKDTRQKHIAAMQLCGVGPRAFAAFFPESDVVPQAAPHNIFPHDIPFSKGIAADEWRASMLRQPRLFLRIRGGQGRVAHALSAKDIPYEWLSDSCIALLNGTRLEGVLPEDAYVVQDASSQATGHFLQGIPGQSWWDCCAGAGGKSLMLADRAMGLQHLCTDVRESILQNLAARFRQYRLPLPERDVLDAADAPAVAAMLSDRRFEGIICDVPCTGSGTWARTPEGCYFFNPVSLEAYVARQKAILKNACEYVTDGGRLIYITCSVFRAENEDVVESVAPGAGMKVLSSELINGLSVGADSLFVAVLERAQK